MLKVIVGVSVILMVYASIYYAVSPVLTNLQNRAILYSEIE